MRVLGIDPGSLNTGYGIIDFSGNNLTLIASGCVSNTSRDTAEKRYIKIFNKLQEIIKQTSPEIVSLENVIYCNNTQIAIKLGEARGVAILAAASMSVPVAEYSPKKIKQAVTGNGNASKIQVQQMIKRLTGLADLPKPDTADAIAAAICHAHNFKKRILTEISLTN